MRWLQENETENGEEQPIGLILCAQGNSEQIELMQLDKSNIRVAEYITELLPKKLLQEKLRLFYKKSKRLIVNRASTSSATDAIEQVPAASTLSLSKGAEGCRRILK